MSTSMETAAAAMKERLVPAVRQDLANYMAWRDINGLATTGRSKHDLMGIRHVEGEEGGAPAEGSSEPPESAEDIAAQRLLDQWQQDDSAPKPGEQQPKGTPGTYDQSYVDKLRKEAGNHRAGKNAVQQKLDAILKAAGAKDDEDPAEVLTTRTGERDTALGERDAATRELAVFKAATAAGADPIKLLDRNSFTSTIKDIDPSDGDGLKAAITAAVEADNTLKAVRGAGASGIEQNGGTGELGQISEAQLAQMSDEEIVDAQQKGLLKGLL